MVQCVCRRVCVILCMSVLAKGLMFYDRFVYIDVVCFDIKTRGDAKVEQEDFLIIM